MSNSNRKLFDNLVSRTKLYLVIILILLLIICIIKAQFIVPSIILYLLIIAYTYFANNKRKSEISEQLQDLTLTVNSTAKTSLINSPFPLLILETNGNIIWKSSKFVSEFGNIDINSYINDLVYDIKSEIDTRENKKDRDIEKQVIIGKNNYKIVGRFVSTKNREKKNKKEYMMILYFIDETENIKLKKEYEDSKNCIGIIMIDNYEEITQRVNNEDRTKAMAEVERVIYEWTNEMNGLLIKSDRDKYVYIFEKRYLENIKENKFSILDKVKEIELSENIQITLSIAISNEGENDSEKFKSAIAGIDVVLGRGGDQAVIRQEGKYLFFGGRAEELEKRTKVKARIVANALEELIRKSKNVVIMGHMNPDIDSMGSSLGVYRLVKSLEKEAYIVNNTKGLTLQNFLDTIGKEEEYNQVFVDKETVLNIIDEETLLIIVDTHKRNYVEVPEVLEKTNNIVIIDHHRRSADFIEPNTLTFQEVYASSASELVTELLQYAKSNVELKNIEAEGLYAGIMMDTKNFTFKTGVRTFEAAAYLRKCGVDIIKVKKWFQSDLESFNKIADIVKKTQIIKNTIGISEYNEIDKEASLICAKAADELLTISDITASFVIGNIGEKICISGRSIGNINVQVILEKLGGGGHITLAGAQVEGMTITEVKEKLIQCIDEYYEEIGN